MKSKLVWVAVIVVLLVGVVAFTQIMPSRLTAATLKQASDVQQKLDQQNNTALAQAAPAPAPKAAEKTAAPAPEQKAATPAPAGKDPNVYKVKFECSNGNFVVEVHRDWAPIGAARFEDLVKQGFYNEDRFFRVVPDFVIQFGLNGDPAVSAKWRNNTIQDEPVKQSNLAGTLTFAKSGRPNSRTTQIFINLKDNKRLDAMGFSAFGKIVEGMDVVRGINPQYGEMPDQGAIQSEGNAYLEKNFPKMDYIKKATIVE